MKLTVPPGVSRLKRSTRASWCSLTNAAPIEEAFSKLKAFLRRVGARTPETLQEALREAFLAIAAHDARGWFTHCGYRSC